VHDLRGDQIGWLIGEPIDLPNFIAGEVRLDPSALIETIRRWHGWFLVILPKLGLVLTDCSSRLPCFYDTETGQIASSPALIMGIDRYRKALDRDLLKAINIDGHGWLPFGLTAISHIRRVLPSHRLSLSDLSTQRYWPTEPVPENANTDRLINLIASRISASIDAIVRPHGALLPLTSGHDSRTILALSKPLVGKLTAMTLKFPGTENDVKVATKLSKIAGIPHQIRPIIRSSEEERENWLGRTGHVVGDMNPRLYKTFYPLAPGTPVLAGIVAPFKALYSLPSDRPDGELTVGSLLGRLTMPQYPLLLKGATEWLASVERFELPQKLDLAYIDNRLGCWSAAPPFGPDFVYRDFAPLVDPLVFEHALAMPHEFKRRKSVGPTIISRYWPELLSVPINCPSVLDRSRVFLRKIRDPEVIRRKLRRLAAH
jgi:hypothetical protein